MFAELIRLGIVKAQASFVPQDGRLVQERKYYLVASNKRNGASVAFQIFNDPLTGQLLSEMSFDIPQPVREKRKVAKK